MTAFEGKVANLTEAVRALAEQPEPAKELKQEESPTQPPSQLTKCYVSDDSESEDESEDEAEDFEETKAPESPAEPNVEEVETVEVDDVKMMELNNNQVQVRVIPMTMASMSNMMHMLNMPVEFTKMQESVTIDLDVADAVDIGAVQDVEVEEVDDVPKINYESMSVKELKELAAAKGAPASLKTKKALTEFLQA